MNLLQVTLTYDRRRISPVPIGTKYDEENPYTMSETYRHPGRRKKYM